MTTSHVQITLRVLGSQADTPLQEAMSLMQTIYRQHMIMSTDLHRHDWRNETSWLHNQIWQIWQNMVCRPITVLSGALTIYFTLLTAAFCFSSSDSVLPCPGTDWP